MRTDAALPAVVADATVRVPLWTGVQPVAGLWFDAARRDDDAHAARVLAHWRTGTQALRFADGDLLRFPQPVLADCATLPGLALCTLDGDRAGAVLASAPLTDAERAAVRGVDVVLVRGARMHGLRLADGAALDPSTWIDLGDLTLHDAFDCSATVAAPPLPPPTRRDVREALGDRIPPPSEERERFLREVVATAAERKRRIAGGKGGARHGAGGGGLGLGIGASLVDRALGWLGAGAGAIAGAGLAHGQRTGTTGGGVSRRTAPRPPSAWRDALTRLAVATRASRLIGWRQGAYLRRMMQRFEDGDPIEALRHALPIDGTGSSLGQAFGTPGRRDDLRLGDQTGASVDIGLDDGTTQHLRDLYRRAFERLDRAGRIDEAAFVLGELLNVRQECLDYLERHGRHVQAAELALTWQMPGATAVRLLLLAGDEARALQVARRDGEFAQTVAALEKTHPALAQRLRLHWGEALADRGEWLAAVDAVWPVPEARNLALGWLRIAEDAGETLSARALVRRATVLPDTAAVHADRIRALARPGHDASDLEAAAAARA
ncbi:MAG: bpX6 domain-containing protein, partial [Lysobacteraceae bacterium]